MKYAQGYDKEKRDARLEELWQYIDFAIIGFLFIMFLSCEVVKACLVRCKMKIKDSLVKICRDKNI